LAGLIVLHLGSTGRELPEASDVAVARAEDQVSADEQAFGTLICHRCGEARTPLNLSALSSEVVRELPSATSSDWFGNGTFGKALDRLSLPNVRCAQQHLWDERRHQPPAPRPIAEVMTDSTPKGS
jgi:hypothetical protein